MASNYQGKRALGGSQPSAPKAKKTKKKKSHKSAIVALCTVIVLAGAAVGGGAYLLKQGGAFDEDTFFTKTTINGVDCGGMTVGQVYDAITEDMSSYELSIVERGSIETITGADIDLAGRPSSADIQAILDHQNKYKILLLKQYFMGSDETVGLVTGYDGSKAEAVVSALKCLNTASMVAPVDASLEKGDEGYYIKDEVDGTTLDVEAAKADILAALKGYKTECDLTTADVYENPAITAEDPSLTSQMDQISKFTSSCITYNLGDTTKVCDGSVISDFLVQDESGDWTLDYDLVHDWVDEMGKETDTYGKEHTFVTHNGDTVTLPNGDFGWRIYRDTTTDKLVEYIKEGTVQTVEPEYYSYGTSRTGNDYGNSYVEVNISAQKVYLYVNGECTLETNCVTGLKGSKERATPSNGIWSIKYKKSPAVLGSYDVQGYESHVTYWMPFNQGVGLHDADGWRSSYGGSIYKYNGSHGCVNLPGSAAKTIYNTVKAGWPVIVYGS